jgi:hypothetical protein
MMTCFNIKHSLKKGSGGSHNGNKSRMIILHVLAYLLIKMIGFFDLSFLYSNNLSCKNYMQDVVDLFLCGIEVELDEHIFLNA